MDCKVFISTCSEQNQRESLWEVLRSKSIFHSVTGYCRGKGVCIRWGMGVSTSCSASDGKHGFRLFQSIAKEEIIPKPDKELQMLVGGQYRVGEAVKLDGNIFLCIDLS